MLGKSDPDAPFSQEQWEQLNKTFAGKHFERMKLHYSDYRGAPRHYCRKLTSNRPHRMGGFHDGVQSEPSENPLGQMLLMQIASDDEMYWCWGDIGAYSSGSGQTISTRSISAESTCSRSAGDEPLQNSLSQNSKRGVIDPVLLSNRDPSMIAL